MLDNLADENYLPNYQDGSIVNLMSSIMMSCGCAVKYKPLEMLDPHELKETRNVLLIILDGLGFEFLNEYGRDSVLYEHFKATMTSVFPATTATAITTFVTGVAPQQHAITGWYVYLKELGVVSTILPFMPRCGGLFLGKAVVDPKVIFDQPTVFEKIKVDSYYVIYGELVNSDYTRTLSRGAQRISYYSLDDFFKQMKDLLLAKTQKKYIYAYWPKLDALCHQYGTKSWEVHSHFKELNDEMVSFLESIRGTSTTVIVTSDHGLIDTDKLHTIKVAEHPQFQDTLTLPVCGEPRLAYCYVHPSKVKDFEAYVAQYFKECTELHRGDELIKKNYFGLYEPHLQLFNRIGDYVLIMKENYVMRDFVVGEKEKYFVGNHGGVSKEEMLVPLIVVKR
jgi:predicted AlkP superfamily pyrophosphatase or phosphodiesterase